MTFSVVIPCYNCVKTLEATVNSICASGLSDYELLLVDDGSTDGTAALCDELCTRHPELRCIHQSNAGVSAARNRGLDEAQGDYLWFVDADDTVDDGALSHAVDITLRQQPDLMIFGMSFDYYHRGRLYSRRRLVPHFDGMLTPEKLKARFQEFYACNALTPVWNKLYRRKKLLESGVRFHEDMTLLEDFLFVLELLPFCRSIYSLPETVYRYRQAEDERGAYRRLKGISDLAGYMQPFEQSMRALGISEKEAAGIYKMLLRQKLYYAPLSEIREMIAEHYQSPYASIKMGSPLGIYLQNRKTQLRHRLAVAVKSSRAYQRYKAGASE